MGRHLHAHSLNATRFTCNALTLRRFQRFIGTHTAQNMQLRSKLMLSVAALALFGLSHSSAASPGQPRNAARLLQSEGPRTTGTCPAQRRRLLCWMKYFCEYCDSDETEHAVDHSKNVERGVDLENQQGGHEDSCCFTCCKIFWDGVCMICTGPYYCYTWLCPPEDTQ